jgi:predicted glycosyltransferase
MTRKSKLSAWAESLGAVSAAESANMTAAQLEAAIENAIVTPSESQPQYSLRDGIAANWAVIRQELPDTIAAVRSNLFG